MSTCLKYSDFCGIHFFIILFSLTLFQDLLLPDWWFFLDAGGDASHAESWLAFIQIHESFLMSTQIISQSWVLHFFSRLFSSSRTLHYLGYLTFSMWCRSLIFKNTFVNFLNRIYKLYLFKTLIKSIEYFIKLTLNLDLYIDYHENHYFLILDQTRRPSTLKNWNFPSKRYKNKYRIREYVLQHNIWTIKVRYFRLWTFDAASADIIRVANLLCRVMWTCCLK